MFELIQRLPKTDLHCHLDGSLRLDTILELAQQAAASSCRRSTAASCSSCSYAGEHVASLDDYLRAFDITLSVMQTEEALERTAYELAEDAWRENVRYIEVRYSPLLHTRDGLRPAQVVEAVLRGLRTAKREFGIRYGVILCAIRSLGARVEPAHRRAVRRVQEPRRRRLRPRRLRGQQPGEGAPPGVPARHRQQHQLHRARRRVVRSRLGRTRRSTSAARTASATAPGSSRTATCSTTSTTTASRSRCARRRTSRPRAATSWETHPVDFYVDYGLRVTINTDNRLMTDTTVSQGAPPLPPALRLVAADDQGDHHRGLQERVHAVPREGRPRRRGEPRALEVRGSAAARSPDASGSSNPASRPPARPGSRRRRTHRRSPSCRSRKLATGS